MTFDRALVIRGGALGDFLLTLPVLDALREACPQAHLEILGCPGIATLAASCGPANAARSIEYGPLAGFFAAGATLDPALTRYFASFDIVISHLYDPDKIFAGNLRAAGVKNLVQGPHRPNPASHAIDQFAAPLAELGIPLARRAVKLTPAPAPKAAPFFAIHPGSGSAAKNWPAARWRALAETLLAGTPALRVAVIGGEADAQVLGPLREITPRDRVDFWESLPLTDLASRLAGADFYLGHDTGISHLAAALGIPALLLFGPTDPGVWAPPHEQVRILRAPDNNLANLKTSAVHAAATQLQRSRVWRRAPPVRREGTQLASSDSRYNNAPS